MCFLNTYLWQIKQPTLGIELASLGFFSDKSWDETVDEI